MTRLLALAAVTAALAVSLTAAQESVFRGGTQTVPIYATVLGADGRLVTDLTKADFQIFDNGRPQPITTFDAGIQPITIVVMLDTSGSMTGNIQTLRNAAVQMFARLLPQDKARVGNFGYRILISPEFTNDMDTLIRAVWLDLEPGGPTPLWGAVNAAMTALAHVDGRRVVLVLTDGKDTGIRQVNGIPIGPTLKEIIARAETEDFMVYAIGMRSRGGPGGFGGPGGPGQAPPGRGGYGGGRMGRGMGDEPDPGLREVASQSGGGYLELTGSADLGAAFAGVADELHKQYQLGYVAPEADGKIHQVEVRVTDPTMQTRARRSYLAPRKSTQP